jgi:hypothetical protein
MAISAKVDNYGLQDALKKMQKLDPAMRRTLLKDTKVAAKPLVDAINARVPQAPPCLEWLTMVGLDGQKSRRFRSP